MKSLLCSDCFRNEGLRLEATKMGMRAAFVCSNCGYRSGSKLRYKHLEKLTNQFFVAATMPHGIGGYAPILQYNPDRPFDEVEFDSDTARDWGLIKSHIKGGLFHYGPPLWRIGVTEHYDDANIVSDKALGEILEKLTIKTIPKGFKTFRIRKNVDPKSVMSPSQYDIPPPEVVREFGRFDDAEVQVLYTSQSVPVCLHECRVAVTDDIFVATFEAAMDLRVADLTADYAQRAASPFEDLRYFFNGIFLTRDESVYGIARRIAASIKSKLAVDGFITDSFFTTISQEPLSQNYCFFPETLERQKLKLHSLNRLHLQTASYSYLFGPNFSNYISP
jgi:hypothetical protein